MKCIWIENRISIETDGYTRPCCLETDDLARITRIENGILNSFNHATLLDLRENLKDGYGPLTKNYCHRCQELEEKGQPSLRTTSGVTEGSRKLKYIQFKLSNQCQLACVHCGSGRSSIWAKINGESPHVKKGFQITENFINELKMLLPDIETLKFSGGEPFLQPEHWKILELLKSENRSHCKIEYITNGISPIRPDLWEGWKSVHCSISADGFEETYEWFRRGSNWTTLLNNIKIIEQYSSVSINFAITPYTVSDYLKSKQFWSNKYNFGEFPVVYPSYCSMLKFPIYYIQQLDKYTDIPYTSGCNPTGDINIFRTWANKIDTMWNTVGKAKQLFWWM
jgi:organic radical activating enzyme